MGGSRRRLKKNKPKVRVGVVKRSKQKKSSIPSGLDYAIGVLASKGAERCEWRSSGTVIRNYSQSKLASDLNSAACQTLCRNPTDLADASEQEMAADDELRSLLGQPVEARKPPPPLTEMQRSVVRALLDQHGDDVEAMTRDRKLNKMLLPARKIRLMLEAFNLYPPNARVKFQQPKKRLW